MDKAAEIDYLDIRVSVPFGIAEDPLRDKDHVPLTDLQALAEVEVAAERKLLRIGGKCLSANQIFS